MSRPARFVRGGLSELPRDLDLDRRIEAWDRAVTQLLSRVDRARGNFSPAIPLRSDGINESKRAFGANWKRNYLLVYNTSSTDTLWVNLSVNAVVGECIPVPPRGNWEPWRAPVNEIHFTGEAANMLAVFIEGSEI